MYEKLGDMLGVFLVTGRMPPERAGKKPQAKKQARAAAKERPIPARLQDDFSLLGFSDGTRSPSKAECARAYRRLVKARHPDTAAEASGALLAEIVEAYKRVSAWYDTAPGT
jgi:hypothetical protein